MSGRPLQITICGYPFLVEWVDTPKNELLKSDGIGCVEVTEQKITVGSQDQGPHQERDTVLHEVLHAVIRMTAHKDDFKDDDHGQERVVYAVTTGLLGVLRANPYLVSWLTEELP